ncbi:NUDIX hydrolase [Candidatus Uhrbacteria bacterium]|nr:NUDIX hydrolase [Candidatus Uhrbacteria bacterium]
MDTTHTVDILVTDRERRVMLVERGKEPFRGKLVLPGGHVDAEDYARARAEPEAALRVSPGKKAASWSHSADTENPLRAIAERIAAARELAEETGVVVEPGELWFNLELNRPGRDPRGHYVSRVYGVGLSPDRLLAARAGSDARRVVIRDVNDVREDEMGFDHYDAILLLQD